MPGEKLGQLGQLEAALSVLNRVTSEEGALLDLLATSLVDLTELTAPIQRRATALTTAHDNIAATKRAVDTLLDHLDTSRRVGLGQGGGAVAGRHGRARRQRWPTQRRVGGRAGREPVSGWGTMAELAGGRVVEAGRTSSQGGQGSGTMC
jgi:hypothetical protein